MNLLICDAPFNVNKTAAAINHIREFPLLKYLYVVEDKEAGNKIKDQCPDFEFPDLEKIEKRHTFSWSHPVAKNYPDDCLSAITLAHHYDYYTRANYEIHQALIALLEEGKNIIITKEYFERFELAEEEYQLGYDFQTWDDDPQYFYTQQFGFKGAFDVGGHLHLLKSYTLIIDSSLNLITGNQLYSQDYGILASSLVHIPTSRETPLIPWRKKQADYGGVFSDYKLLAYDKALVYFDNSTARIFPVAMMEAFEQVFWLTFLREGTLLYYYFKFAEKLTTINTKELYVKYDCFTLTPCDYNIDQYKSKITIVNNKLNDFGDNNYSAYTRKWYSTLPDEGFDNISKNIRSFYRSGFNHILNVKSVAWTSPAEHTSSIGVPGYLKGYIEELAPETNTPLSKTALAYISNTLMNPHLKRFLNCYDIKVDTDKYAFCVFLRWLFYTGLSATKTTGANTTVYVPSVRMRDMLIKWANLKSEELDEDFVTEADTCDWFNYAYEDEEEE